MPKSTKLYLNNRYKLRNSQTTFRLFRSEGKYPNRPGIQVLQKYRSERVEEYTTCGILVESGEPWWRIRSKAQQPFLKTKNVNNYVPILGQISDEFIDR